MPLLKLILKLTMLSFKSRNTDKLV